MEVLNKAATAQTPSVIFDGNKGVLKLEGKSYSDDVNLSFADLMSYIEMYANNPQTTTVIDFKWLYYNTATTRIIVKIILRIAEFSKVKINWHCKDDFSLMIKKGEEIKEALDVDLTVITYRPEENG